MSKGNAAPSPRIREQNQTMTSSILIKSRIVRRLVVAAVLAAPSIAASTTKHHAHAHLSSQQQHQSSRRRHESSSSTSLSSVYNRNPIPRRQRQLQQLEESSSLSAPHSLTLHLTFDSHPEEVSWKFQNARTQKVLDGVGFGVYDTGKVGQTVQESLNILNDLDYEGDTNNTLREYRFVIYDRGGNGICCTNGSGKYEIYSKGSIVAEGNSFGSIEERLFSIDPRVYLEEEVDESQTTATTIAAATSVGSTNPPPTESVGDNNSSPAPSSSSGNINADDNNNNNNSTNNNSTDNQRPSSKPTKPPQKQTANDQTYWFCGISWDWVTSHCDEAKPCPGGDAVDCPANQACFASTPCTLAPSQRPSTDPSSMPSEVPSPSPTKAPWSEAAFVEFLNGQSDNNGNDGAENNADVASSTNSSEVKEVLENDSSLQYHFYCGISWTHADETCEVFCPSGDKIDCPSGQECFANTRCDGRITASPSSVPADVSGTDSTNVVGGDVCSLCNGKRLDPTKSIDFQSQTTTCGSLDAMLISAMQAEENPVVQSATCNSVRGMYKDDCCSEECQLCKSSGGNLLDLKGDVVVQQGGYDASCRDINIMLSKSYSATESMCTDARTELADTCCYQQCTLCTDQSESESTFWFNTVLYQGLTTTCLGLDYLLRAEQLMDGSDRCSALQEQYTNQCCYQTANSCQLCDAASDNKFELDSNKIVTVQQSSTTKPCSALNYSLAKYQKSDAQCQEERQVYFSECCVLKTDAVTEFDPTSIGGSVETNSTPVATPSGQNTAIYSPPTASAEGTPNSSSSTNGDSGSIPSPSPIGEVTPVVGETAEFSSGQSATIAPSQSHYWDSPAEFDWEQVWDPPDRNSGLYSTRLGPLALCGVMVQLLHVYA